MILITGASSGIGAGIARKLAASGAILLLGARRIDRLQTLAEELQQHGVEVAVAPLDVTSRLSVQQVAQVALDKWGRIDVMINSAGVMPLSPLAALKVDEWDQMINVNIKGVLYGITGALAVSPTAAVYCATKFAVQAISDDLRQENTQLHVTCVHPGVVESELAGTIMDASAAALMNEYRAIALQPDAIGRAVRFAIEQPDEVDVSEIVVRPTRSPN
ncbi:SDR family oxidoreductase [Candidatus Pantoea persica]|uniref:SDR family oxidoreductase n=1 Tax=Candidatus Pantoea persica TaxID=2518128 RepID=UPI00215D5ED6|nr:SDR family oxidoreductase [Candidatus Pantoea persica]MBA2814006.1 oxidoreductase [Candidatus Pantoea persica]